MLSMLSDKRRLNFSNIPYKRLQTGKVTGQANQMEIMILNAAAAATERLGHKSMKKANVQQVSNVINEEASRVAMKLASMLGIESDVLQRLIAQLPIFARHVNLAKQTEDAMANASMRNSQALMMMNANLGIASMGLSVFSHSPMMRRWRQTLCKHLWSLWVLSMVASTFSMGAWAFRWWTQPLKRWVKKRHRIP